MDRVDPITLSTTWHFMQRVCREMRETAERTASNVLIATLHDLAYGIWDRNARPVAIPEGFPPRLISSTYPIRRILEKFGEDIRPGDQFLTNFPPDGAAHLPDWTVVRPIFHKGELVFFSCMGTHVPDNGGAQPGTMFLARDSIAEGLNIPLVKIAENDRLREDLLELILANNRMPEMMRRELACLMGSNTIADRRLQELVGRYGPETVYACIDEMIERSEAAVRQQIRSWPDGVYEAEAQIDHDSFNLDRPVTARVKLTVKGDEAEFDFSGSDDQVPGMINCYLHQTESNTLCSAFLFLGAELAPYHNAGSIRPFKVISRPGTFVACNKGALVAAAPSHGGGVVIEAVLAVLSKALPHRAIASYSRLMTAHIVGRDSRNDDRLYVWVCFSPAAGAGAVHGFDGYQSACDVGTLGVVGKTDAEEEMTRFPWEILRYEYRTDAHGAGQWRGAPGLVWEAVHLGQIAHTRGAAQGQKTQGQGQLGGQPTPNNRSFIEKGGERIHIRNPGQDHAIGHMDRLVCFSGGGAGVGEPWRRDPEKVLADVLDELVSIEWAAEAYRVVIDPETLRIDRHATETLRGTIPAQPEEMVK